MGTELFHTLCHVVARSLPGRRSLAWLLRHPDRCPICRATQDREARLSALLYQVAREEAVSREEAAGADPFIVRLWARIDRETPLAPRVIRHLPARFAVGVALLASLTLAVAWWSGRANIPSAPTAVAQRPDLPGQPSQPARRSPGEWPSHRSPQVGAAAGSPVQRPSRRDATTLAPRFSVGTGGAPRGTSGRRRQGQAVLPSPGGTTELTHAIARSPAGDLADLNADPAQSTRGWAHLPANEWDAIEARVRSRVPVKDDFVTIPFPRLAAASDRAVVAATEAYQHEAAVVDARLAREVTCAFKATALSDLCDRLRADTGIHLVAASSVADEKVTAFCEKQPLRDVMRQLSRPFGYTWLRSRSASGVGRSALGKDPADPNAERPTPNAEYRYELVQDLKSQLLEEELRNRDRNAALVAMAQEAEHFRPYLDLSPDEALARAATSAPEEKKLLEYFAGKGWGPAQLYSRLTPADQVALRAGQTVTFSASPGPGEQPLPPELARSVIASLRDYRIVRQGDRYDAGPVKYMPDGLAPAEVPEAQPIVSLKLIRSELGQISLQGLSGFFLGTPPNALQLMGDGERNLATGISPAVRSPRNAVANAALAHDPDLQRHVSVRPPADPTPLGRTEQGRETSPKTSDRLSPPSPVRGQERSDARGGGGVSPITTADVLEALHRATGMNIVSDYYTRLLRPEDVSVQNQTSFEALNRLADAMRMRWRKDSGWLQFRSAGFFNDRLKEVPNRLLNRWAAARRRHGALTLEEMVEIAQLSDAQLDSDTMAEGARALYGLVEWRLARDGFLRPNWRYLAGFSPEQRRAAQSPAGLPFRQMPLAQQQRFLALALGSGTDRLDLLDDLARAALQVDYVPPVGFQLKGSQTTTPFDHGLDAPLIWGQTREAALQLARQTDPDVTEAQILPAELGVTFTYRLGGPNARLTPMIVHADSHNVIARPPQPVQSAR